MNYRNIFSAGGVCILCKFIINLMYEDDWLQALSNFKAQSLAEAVRLVAVLKSE